VIYRNLRRHLRGSWRSFWLGRSGRFAARMASLGTAPYHGRAHLADLNSRGFTAASAAISHPEIRRGRHVYLGDNVVISHCENGGTVEFGDRVHLYGDTFVETGAGASIRIGERTHIQPGCHLHAFLSDITIGGSVEIAAGCAFYSYDHGIAPGVAIMDQPLTTKGAITIGDGAWLGHRVTVLQGVTIGAGAVIAAGSVVVRDIPENAIAAGVPCKVIKYRDHVKP
jgi:acetyltransferase-like isoleucine patch superfamily enzyme